jgi:hypothetical protein
MCAEHLDNGARIPKGRKGVDLQTNPLAIDRKLDRTDDFRLEPDALDRSPLIS